MPSKKYFERRFARVGIFRQRPQERVGEHGVGDGVIDPLVGQRRGERTELEDSRSSGGNGVRTDRHGRKEQDEGEGEREKSVSQDFLTVREGGRAAHEEPTIGSSSN